jgi:prepilin-type N-terminal cleavage/methylation domain-containing protein
MLVALNPHQDKPVSQGKAISPSMIMKPRGLTLIELMVTVAIMAILLVLAVPSFNAFLARGRLSGAAEGLAQDLQLAKSEALRSNADVTISFSPVGAWCYGAVVSTTACDCTDQVPPCSLRRVDSTAYSGVTMDATSFTGNATTFSARLGMASPGWVDLTHPNAGTLRVSVGEAGQTTPSSQVRICSTSGGLGHHPACP